MTKMIETVRRGSAGVPISERFANEIYDNARGRMTPVELRDACLAVICGMVSCGELTVTEAAGGMESIAKGIRDGVPFVHAEMNRQ